MKSRSYSDYFAVDESYYSEITPNSTRDPRSKWQATFPHEQVVKIFETLEKVLSRGRNEDKKNIWIDGAYGTGKSRILWTMKSLLDCPPQDLIAYFDSYDSLKNKTDLRDKFLAAKKRETVTVHRYATGGINSMQTLIRAVFDSVETELRRRNFKFNGAQTLRGKIAAWLEADSANMQLFRAKIQKPDYRNSTGLVNRSAEDILADLKNPEMIVDTLIDDILTLGEKEGIRAFEIQMEDLKQWLAEVIDANNLKAVVFFWDEFSSFFKNHRNNLDEFQKLVELSTEKPFCMIIATQKAEDLLNERDASFKTLRDRFIRREITMPDNIAFELIVDAFKIKSEAETEWKIIVEALSARTEKSRATVKNTLAVQQIRVSEKTLVGLLPIHPLAALLLKNISSFFASNQRSMFNFIKTSEAETADTFQRFIETNSPQSGSLLTIDYLWDFFYEKGKDTAGYGRDNLDESIRVILDSYRTYAENLNEEARQVLKTILMLQAMTRKARNVDLFLPSAKNLDLAFNGVDNLENGRAVNIAQDLVAKNILFVNPGKIETFSVVTTASDSVKLQAIQNSIQQNLRTAKLVEEGNFQQIFMLSAATNLRCHFIELSPDNFKSILSRITTRDFKINAAVCYACDAAERKKILELIRDAVKNPRYNEIVFIDAAQNVLGEERLKQYVKTKADEEYHRETDASRAADSKHKAELCIEEWRSEIEAGSFVIYPVTNSAQRTAFTCDTKTSLLHELAANVLKIYPLSFDNVPVSDNFFNSTNLKQGATFGILRRTGQSFKDAEIKNLLREVWSEENYWKSQPELPVSQLKILLDQFIAEQIQLNVRVSFAAIWELLQEKGFMPCNLYAFLAGFLMREYAQEPYRYSEDEDGFIGGTMSAEKLATFISDAMSVSAKTGKFAAPKYLEIMSKNQQNFIDFARRVFGVPDEISVEKCANKIRLKMEEARYPLWCYAEGAEDSYGSFFQNLEKLANPSANYNVAELTEHLGKFLSENPAHAEYLKNRFTKENAHTALKNFLLEFESGIIFELSDELEIADVIAEIQNHVASGEKAWLWNKDTAVEIIDRLIIDYKIIAASRKLGLDCNSWRTCIAKWLSTASFIKIPCRILTTIYPALENFFAGLQEIAHRGELSHEKRKIFLESLQTYPAEIFNLRENAWKILRQKYPALLGDLGDDEIKKICVQLPTTSFADSTEIFNRNLSACVEKFQREQLKFKLKNLWQELTQSPSPRAWSRKNRTPVFALVPDEEKSSANRVFEALESNAQEQEISFAIEYLKKSPAWLANLTAPEKIDEAFSRRIIKENQVLLTDLAEVRAILESRVSGEPYSWLTFEREKVERVIGEVAKEKYYSGGANARIVEKVRRMSDEKAKKYLLKLLEGNYKIGLQILAEEI